MRFTVTCPRCQNHYQVDAGLRGRNMRCPNTLCRAVFRVSEDKAIPPPAEPESRPVKEDSSGSRQVSGQVSDLVQLLPAEAATSPQTPGEEIPVPESPPAETAAEGTEEKPAQEPVSPSPPPREIIKKPAGQQEETPREMAPGTWDAPPIRRPVNQQTLPGDEVVEVSVGTRVAGSEVLRSPGSSTSTGASEYLRPGHPEIFPSAHSPPDVSRETSGARARRRSLVIILGLLLILGGGLGLGIYHVRGKQAENEVQRFQKAEGLYQNRAFTEAVLVLQGLYRDFPGSKDRNLYSFLAELSSVREAVFSPHENPEESVQATQNLGQFLDVYRNDPNLKDRQADVWETLYHLTKELTNFAEQKNDSTLLALARRTWSEAGKFKALENVNVLEMGRETQAEFTRIDRLLTIRVQREEALAVLQNLAERPSVPALQEARVLVEKAGLKGDPQAAVLLEALVKGHREQVVFVAAEKQADQEPELPQTRVEDLYPTVVLGPGPSSARQETKGDTGLSGKPLLALARGVLYALEPKQGEIRWARRVGIDTQILPLQVPASPYMPAMVLALSSDSKGVWGLEAATGKILWHHQLPAPCLGQPVLVDHVLLVPTISGRVEEITVDTGRLQGSYQVGQSLTLGGVYQKGTSLVYFPADEYAIYVLDVTKRQCAAILYSQHPPGSLRSLPLVLPEGVESGLESSPGKSQWLALIQAQGNEAVRTRLYSLPIQSPDQQPLDLEMRIPGWTWFPPWHDGEQLALATDSGYLTPLGIRQKGDRDPVLFPLLTGDFLVEGTGKTTRGRAQVAHADPENYWVLTQGRLHRLEKTFAANKGPGLVRRWPEPPELGSPLHETQVFSPSPGQTHLMTVTQALDDPTCLASAVDATTGHIQWQRQLGMVVQSPPVVLGGKILIQDVRGLFSIVQDQLISAKNSLWQMSQPLLLIPTMAQDHNLLLPGPKSLYHLSWRKNENKVRVHALTSEADTVGSPLTMALGAPVQGTPAVVGDYLVLPLANGMTEFHSLIGEKQRFLGPDWRAVGADELAPGHVVSLDQGHMVITDGSRGLTIIFLAHPKAWEKKSSFQLPQRILDTPSVLRTKEDTLLCVADASDSVTLLKADRLQLVKRWALSGKISGGPFVLGGGVACVLGKDRLVWLDPAKDQPAWEYNFLAPLAGPPQMVDDVIVVVDLAGHFQALDPATGRPLSGGYTLHADIAPSSALLPLGNKQLLVPLSDGTMMVLPMRVLKEGK